jgi:hypothetical protein
VTPEELSERLLEFAVRVCKVVEALPDTRLGRHVAGQLVRCGTSPAPNYEEACAAESRADFVHKLSICLKELPESRLSRPSKQARNRNSYPLSAMRKPSVVNSQFAMINFQFAIESIPKR